jgi:hypothetical protein
LGIIIILLILDLIHLAVLLFKNLIVILNDDRFGVVEPYDNKAGIFVLRELLDIVKGEGNLALSDVLGGLLKLSLPDNVIVLLYYLGKQDTVTGDNGSHRWAVYSKCIPSGRVKLLPQVHPASAHISSKSLEKGLRP